MRGVRSTLVLLVILVGIFAYIYFVESKKEPGADTEKRPKVFSLDASKIDELEVKLSSGQQTVLKRSDGAWQMVQPMPAHADEGEVSGITSNLASLESQRVVDESPSDLKQYGLAEPRVDVGFKAAGDKDFRHLYIGDKTATGGDLYAKLPNQKKVFLISGYLDSTFSRTPFDLRDKTILKFDRDKVDTIDVQTDSGTVEFVKAGGDWTITKPQQVRADYAAVEGLIGRLQTAQMKSIRAPEATEFRQYGLDKPQLTAILGAGSARATLEMGDKAEDGSIYARDASRPTVFTVEASLLDDLKKPADDYRRKDIFEFRSFNADSIEITRGNETLAFEKVKGQGSTPSDKWRQVKPAARDVDQSKMETFLSKLSNLRAQSFADAKTKTGLETPAVEVAVRFSDGKKQERVVFGRAGTDLYAGRTSEPGAAKLDATDFDDAMKALDALK
jgi:hypothetical protein